MYNVKTALLSTLAMLFASVHLAQTPTISWQKTLGGTQSDVGKTFLETVDGSKVICSASASPVSGDKTEPSFGDFDYWIVKLDANGTILWQTTIGGSGQDEPLAVVETNDHGFLVIGFTSSPVSGNKIDTLYGKLDGWVVKLNSSGNIEWQKTYGGLDDDLLKDVIALPDGTFVIGGDSDSDISGNKTVASKGGFDFWIIHISSDGSILDQWVYGGSAYEGLSSILKIAGNKFVFSGVSSSDISGDKLENSFGLSDYWVIITDSLGNIVQSGTYGGSSYEFFGGIITNAASDINLYGHSFSPASGSKTAQNYGIADYWLVKLDSNLNMAWDKSLGGDNAEEIFGHVSVYSEILQLTIIGGTSKSGISGNKTLPSFGNDDFWITGLNNNGDKTFEFVAGGFDLDRSFRAMENYASKIMVLGLSRSGISGNKNEPSIGMGDTWIIELDFNVSVEEIPLDNTISAYPIPARTALHFAVPVGASNATIKLVDMQGKIVHYETGFVNANGEIDVTGFTPGVYILSMEGERFAYTRRVVIE